MNNQTRRYIMEESPCPDCGGEGAKAMSALCCDVNCFTCNGKRIVTKKVPFGEALLAELASLGLVAGAMDK